jgi:delta24(24(1))-sterol reductase
MGVELNPRLGILDFKMWAEIRLSWMTLFLITLSCAVKFYETHGYISGPMGTLLMIHLIYSNACMKGEECVLSTWDIFYEKWGWMLIYWNIAGIPFSYTFHSLYLLKQPPFENPLPWTIFLIVLYLAAYYVWDTSQA